jgi:uncharacterized protein with NRDE domain
MAGMCLLVVTFRPDQDTPLLLADNRDEFHGRQGQPPRVLSPRPWVWGGRDPLEGGTWLGINEYGLVVALTNGPADQVDRRRRSRGQLCLDALAQASPSALLDWLREETRRQPYNPFNLFWSDGASAHTAYWRDALDIEPLSPGFHALANGSRFNDWTVPRVSRARHLLAGVEEEPIDEAMKRLKSACSDHGERPEEALCVHREETGTVSSTLLALRPSAVGTSVYWYADGPPCSHPFADLSLLLKQSLPRTRPRQGDVPTSPPG